MDPKMDSGINTNLTPLTFETAAQSGHLPLTDITPEQFIGNLFCDKRSCSTTSDSCIKLGTVTLRQRCGTV